MNLEWEEHMELAGGKKLHLSGVRTLNWINVKERLPEKYQQYLCAVSLEDYPSLPVLYDCAIFHPQSKKWIGLHEKLRVTHWMPLPHLPPQVNP